MTDAVGFARQFRLLLKGLETDVVAADAVQVARETGLIVFPTKRIPA